MGCRLVTLQDDQESTEKQNSEPTRMTVRPSSEEERTQLEREEPEAVETYPTKEGTLELFDGADGPPTVTSQLSDIVDLCEGMEEQDVQDEAEAVLERILRAQFQVEKLGDAAPVEAVTRLSDVDARFQAFLGEYTSQRETAGFALRGFEDELNALETQLDTLNGF
ncbi:hypothetical protein PRNP1_004534 [Phytophthora ramorum]